MRKILILSLALSLTMGAAATTPTTADTVSVTPTSPTSPYTPLRPTYLKGVLVSSPWTSNWFLQASVGTTVFLGTPLGCNDLFGRMRPAFSVALGKWFTPSVGGRITYGGPRFTDCTNSSQHYQYLRADFLWNVLGTHYKEDIHALSRWSLIPFVGLGILHNKDNAHKPLAISYGIQAQYHLSRRLALTAEIGSMTTMQDFDGIGKPHRLGDHLLSASLGLSVHIGKSGWKRAVDARPYIAQNEWLSAYAASLSDTTSNVASQPPFPTISLSGLRAFPPFLACRSIPSLVQFSYTPFFDFSQFSMLIFLNFIFLIHFPHYIIGLCRYFFVPLHPNSTALVALDPDMPRRFSLLPSLSLAQRQELKYSRITDYQHDVRSPMSILNQVLCRIG